MVSGSYIDVLFVYFVADSSSKDSNEAVNSRVCIRGYCTLLHIKVKHVYMFVYRCCTCMHVLNSSQH